MTKLFVRHRRHVGKGAGRPRFAIVAVQGDLNVFKTRVRRAELTKIAAEIDAEIVYLPRGEQADGPEAEGGQGQRSRRRKRD